MPKIPLKRVGLTNTVVSKFTCIPAVNCGAKAKTALLFDTDFPRLAVRATLSGSKSFVFEGSLGGRSISITIGNVRTIGIEDARARARKLQGKIDEGIDPREEALEKKIAESEKKRLEEEQHQLAQKYTLKALCEQYVDHLKSRGKVKTATDCMSAFRCHVFTSDFASKPAKDVTPIEIAQIIRKIYESGKKRTANVVRAYLVAAYNIGRKAPTSFTVKSELIPFQITVNPAYGIETEKTPVGERHLSDKEIKAYLNVLTNSLADQTLKVGFYAGGQRMAQLVRAKVSDYNNGVLRLKDPKGKRTVAREHLLPLAPISKSIVEGLIENKPQEALIFNISARTVGSRITELCKDHQLAKFDVKDIRRSVETILASMGINKETRAQLLSHGLGGVQNKIYDKHSYMNEKLSALNALENRLEGLRTGAIKGDDKVRYINAAV